MIVKDEFCEKVRQYEDTMYALAYSLLHNDEDAADAISESIVKAYCSVSQLKNSHAFKPWLLKIVNNTCLEMLRNRPVTLNIDEQYDVEDDSSNRDWSTKLVLREAVEKLPQPYRTVLVLFYYENLSTIEISTITGDSVIAVKKQLSRARNMLREALNKEDFF